MHADVIFVWYRNASWNGLFRGRQLNHQQHHLTTRARTTLHDNNNNDDKNNNNNNIINSNWKHSGGYSSENSLVIKRLHFDIFQTHDLIRIINNACIKRKKCYHSSFVHHTYISVIELKSFVNSINNQSIKPSNWKLTNK